MELDKLAKIFKALSNEQRLKIFLMIYNNDGSSDEITEESCCKEVDKSFTQCCNAVNLSRSTISHHMKELEQAGLIIKRREGNKFVTKANIEAVKAIHDFL